MHEHSEKRYTVGMPVPPPGTLQSYLYQLPIFFSNVIIPFLLGVAFLIFVINVVRYFVFQGSEEDGREAARAQALYSIAAFVVLAIFWGIVILLTNSFGFGRQTVPCPDYLQGAPNSPCASGTF